MKYPYPVIYIEWIDSVSNDDKWIDVRSANEWAEYDEGIIKQVGFILNETEKYLLLVSRVCDHENESERMVRGIMKVPKESIIKRINFKK